MDGEENETAAPKNRRPWIFASPLPAMMIAVVVVALMYCANLWIKAKGRELERELTTLELESIEFEDTRLGQAIEELNRQIYEKAPHLGPETIQRAVPETFRVLSESDNADGFGFSEVFVPYEPDKHDIKITLSLSNAPAIEAIRYTASLSGGSYSVGGGKINVINFHAPLPNHWIEEPFDWISLRYERLKYRYQEWQFWRAYHSGSGSSPVLTDPFL